MTENTDYNPARRVADAKARLIAQEEEIAANIQQAIDQEKAAWKAYVNGDLTAEEEQAQRAATQFIVREQIKFLIGNRQVHRERHDMMDEAPPEEFSALDPGLVDLRRIRIYDVMHDDSFIEDWLLARPEVRLLENLTGKVAASKIETLEKKLNAGEISPGEMALRQWRAAWYYLHIRCLASGDHRSNPRMRDYLTSQLLPWLDDLLRDYLRENADSISAE